MFTVGILTARQSVAAVADPVSSGAIVDNIRGIADDRKAPIAIAGDNTYIKWWTNKTGNDEVNFRASNDGGATFGDKMDLSNSTDAKS
jgi:hypothetical protein